jgi:hypothetical protein
VILSPPSDNSAPSGLATIRLSARTKRPFLRGNPVRVPFQVIGEPVDGGTQPPPATPYGDPSRPVVDAALNQKPILSKGVLTALVLLVAGVAALVAFVLTRPPSAAETLASRGSPPKGVLRVTGTTPDSVSLAWDPVELAERYNLLQVDPATQNPIKVDPLDAALTGTTVVGLAAEKDVCFRLTVTRGGLTGPPSDLVCTKTAAAPATATPTPAATASAVAPSPSPVTSTTSAPAPSPTQTFSPGDPNTDPIMKQQWIAVGAVLPKTVAESDVQIHVQQLVAAGLPAKYLDSRFYPRMVIYTSTPPPAPSPTPEESWVVFLGPFPTQPDADGQCPMITQAQGGTFCVTAQADPPR